MSPQVQSNAERTKRPGRRGLPSNFDGLIRRWLAARLSKKAATRVANELAASNAECKNDFGMQLPLQLLGSAALLQLARGKDTSLVSVGADTYGAMMSF